MSLFGRERLDLPAARLQVHFRVDLQIHAAAHRMHDAVSDGDSTVSAHAGAGLVSQRLGKGFSFRGVIDQHIRHSEGFANIKSWQARADESSHVVDREEWFVDRSHEDNGWRMRV